MNVEIDVGQTDRQTGTMLINMKSIKKMTIHQTEEENDQSDEERSDGLLTEPMVYCAMRD